MKLFKKILATLLAMLMVLTAQGGVFIALADEAANTASTINSNIELDLPVFISPETEGIGKHVKRLKEDENEYMAIYENEDGSITVYSFGSPIQYYDENNQLTDYDPRLKEVKNSEKKNAGYAYEITSSDVSVMLPSDIVTDKYITLEKDKYKIDFKPITQYDNSEKVKDIDKDETKDEYKVKEIKIDKENNKSDLAGTEYLSAESDKIKYKYITTNTGVTEHIIFEEAPASNILQFEIKLKDLVPKIDQYGQITFNDEKTGEQVAQMTPFFMYDSYTRDPDSDPDDANSFNAHLSEDIKIEIAQDKSNDKKYILTVYLDEDMLYGEDTVYPVTVDPDIYYRRADLTMYDTYACSNRPDQNYSGATSNYVGRSSTGRYRGYYKFPLPTGYNAYELTHCYYVAWNHSPDTTAAYIDCHRLVENWNPTQLTWTNRPQFDLSRTSSQTVKVNGQYYVWNLLPMAQNWTEYIRTDGASGYPNYGFMLRDRDEINKLRWFSSYENPYYRPYVRLNYKQDDIAPPNVPSLDATAIPGLLNSGEGSVKVEWDAVTDTGTPDCSGLDGYYLELYEGSVDNGTKISEHYIAAGGDTDYTFTGLDDNKTYQCTIMAKDNANNESVALTTSNTANLPDRTEPALPTSFNATSDLGALNSGEGSIELVWNEAFDNVGVTEYELAVYTDFVHPDNFVKSHIYTVSSSLPSYSYTFNNIGDNQTYQCSIIARDNEGNFTQTPETSMVTIGDRTGPTAPTTLTVSPNDWTNDTTPEVTWAGMTDHTVLNVSIEHSADNGTTWNPTQWSGLDGSGTFDASVFTADGEHSIQIRGIDEEGNTGDASIVVVYKRDTAVDNALITEPTSTQIVGSVVIKGNVSDGLSGVKSWKLEYGEGISPITWNNIQPSPEAPLFGEGFTFATWDATNLSIGDYTVKLTVEDNAGNIKTDTIIVTKNATATSIQPTLTIQSPEDVKEFSDSSQAQVPVTYTWATGDSSTLKAKVYIDGMLKAEEAIAGSGLTIDINEFEEGVTHNIFIIAEGSQLECSDDMYEAVLSDDFEATPIANLTTVVLDQGKLVLEDINGTYYSGGVIESTFIDNTVLGYAFSAELTVSEYKPVDTDIVYSLSLDNGLTWHPITPGTVLDLEGVIDPEIQIKAEMSTQNSIETPELESWSIKINSVSGASLNTFTVNLVDVPFNVSATPDANYMTLVDWDYTNPAGTTYNVYRSTDPNFIPSTENLAAPNVDQTFWYDYNLNYGQTFYYKVTAVTTVNLIERESVPSQVSGGAQVVSADELDKMLGLQDYWRYSSFRTGTGSGYINVAEGNMVYTSTDSVYPGMLLAMVMRRTYNSQADTKTTLGYGWDFSYNTCLMREYDANGYELGMILKDGDGSLHHFVVDQSNPGNYLTPDGLFMELKYDSDTKGYIVERKDNIRYVFDENMKLIKMTEFDRNYIEFEYYESGRLLSAINNIGDMATFFYYQNGDSNADFYTMDADKIGLVAQMMDPAGRVFNYDYCANTGELETASLYIEGEPNYTESFVYASTGHNITDIYDAKSNRTQIGYDNEKANLVTFPDISEHYSLAYAAGTTTITDRWNRNTVYNYDSAGCVTGITNVDGKITNYTYDTEDLVVRKISYQNDVGTTSNVLLEYTIEYDINGNIKSVKTTEGGITKYESYNQFNQVGLIKVIVDAENTEAWTAFEYDDTGVNPTGNLLSTTVYDADTVTPLVTTTYTYNSTYGLLETATSSLGTTTEYVYYDYYDATSDEYEPYFGWLKEIKQGKTGTVLTTVSRVTQYDAQGNPTVLEDALGHKTRMYYDTLGRAYKTCLPDDTDSTWDDNKYTSVDYDMNHNVIQTKDITGMITTFDYDDMDRLIETTVDFGGLALTSSIDYGTYTEGTETYRKVTYTDAEGSKAIEYYDKLGRVVKTAIDDGIGNEIVTATYIYDNVGNMTWVTDSEGVVANAQYDAMNRQVQTIIDPGTDPENRNITNSVAYNYVGQVIKATDGEGNVTAYDYDIMGRIEAVRQGPNAGDTDKTNDIKTSYDYNLSASAYASYGAVIMNNITDANGHVKETYLDAFGRPVVEVNLGNGAGGNEMIVYRTYYDNGQIETMTHADGQVDEYFYTDWGKIDLIEYGTVANNFTDYTYDQYGRLREMDDSRTDYDTPTTIHTSHCEWKYDTIGRVNQYQQDNNVIDYWYNSVGQVETITFKDDIDVLTSPTTTIGYTYDGYGRLDKVQKKVGTGSYMDVRDYEYIQNQINLEHTVDYVGFDDVNNSNTMETWYDYNSIGQLASIKYYNGADQTNLTESYIYEYNDRGYIETEDIWSCYTESGTTNTISTDIYKVHTYDGLGRLEQTDTTVGTATPTTTSWTYDNVGNRLTQEDAEGILDYDYNEFNQLTEIDIIVSGTTYEYMDYAYNTRGAQTQQIETLAGGGTETIDYNYDYAGRLAKTDDGTDITKHLYNGSGQRIWQEYYDGTSTEETRYYYTGSSLLFTTDTDNDKLTENIVTPGGSIIASKRFTGSFANEFYFFNYDIRQSVTTILDDNLELMQGYEYDEFGNQTVSGNSTFLNEVTFTGAIADSTGLYYMNARFYNPNTGRFLTQDTYTGNAYEPWSQHLYSYTGNNPVNYIDPTGHFVCTIGGAVAGALLGALNAALNGEDIAQGAISGGITGAVVGAAADIIIASGGTAAIGMAAIGASTLGGVSTAGVIAGGIITSAFVGSAGYIGGVAGDLAGQTYSNSQTGGTGYDYEQAHENGVSSGLAAALCANMLIFPLCPDLGIKHATAQYIATGNNAQFIKAWFIITGRKIISTAGNNVVNEFITNPIVEYICNDSLNNQRKIYDKVDHDVDPINYNLGNTSANIPFEGFGNVVAEAK